MSDQSIPKTPPVTPGVNTLPSEWQLFLKELLRRVADLEASAADYETRITALEPP